MADPGLNRLLQWSIANSATPAAPTGPTGIRAVATNGDENSVPTVGGREVPLENPQAPQLNEDMLRSLLGGPSDADLMKASIVAIQDPTLELSQKEIAFENFEMLIQQIDNANNINSMGLWEPLLRLLSSEEEVLRRMAALCVSTAVQNNDKAQKHLMEANGIPQIVKMAYSDPNLLVRKKAILALSSTVRNYQEGLDLVVEYLPERYKPKSGKTVDASSMDEVDVIIGAMRADVVSALAGR